MKVNRAIKADKLAELETFIVNAAERKKQHSCLDIKYLKRFLL